jgi:hypothetical protein
MTRLVEAWEKLWSALTGEWMLRRGCPNGGTVIFCRTVQITLILYLIGLWLRSLFVFGVALPWHSQFSALWYNGVDTLPWLGGIFAAVYAALYARFASQWSYLAGVYNQMRQTLVTTEEPNGDHLVMWRAAFIEDALDLHLATKPMFRPFLLRMLDMPPVAAKFDDYTVDGEERREQLEERLRKRGGHLPRRAAEGVVKELLELPGLTEAKQNDLRDLCTALCDNDVFQAALTEHDARRVVRAIAWASVLQNQVCADAAPVVMERANAVQAGAFGFWDNRGTAGRALHSAARVLGELRPRREWSQVQILSARPSGIGSDLL